MAEVEYGNRALQGGREITGVLKGYDQLLNIVMDNTTGEFGFGRFVCHRDQDPDLILAPLFSRISTRS